MRDFTEMELKKEDWERLWGIIGANVEGNMERGIPLWKQFCAVYLEGLDHGSAIQNEINARELAGRDALDGTGDLGIVVGSSDPSLRRKS
jgi:hypothetical protein